MGDRRYPALATSTDAQFAETAVAWSANTGVPVTRFHARFTASAAVGVTRA